MPTNCLSVLDHFVGLVLNSFHLTHIRPALPFYTPWKHYKIRDFLKIFQGVQKRNIDLKWVIDKNKSKIWLKESLIAFEISFSLIYLSNLIYSWNTSSTFISDARLKLAKNLANAKRLLKLNFHYLKIIHIFIMFSSKKYDIFWKKKQKNNPIDTGSKLNVHKTFRKRPGRLLKVLCAFSLRPVSTGFIVTRFCAFLWTLPYRPILNSYTFSVSAQQLFFGLIHPALIQPNFNFFFWVMVCLIRNLKHQILFAISM